MPCIEGGAFFSTLYEEYKDLGFEVIGVNLDTPDTVKAIADMEEFKRIRNINFKSLYDHDLKVAKMYNVKTIPVTFLIDRQGYIKKIWFGFRIQWAQEFREEIEKYLKKGID
ncbi:MAG: Thiol-disulfide oxidoreductase ResA [candidate division WS2 bacterium]|uniref:Thiol-disulfide oxidoreductase ResA n=1 Tax=Psychracetigena formicireducens TaxID=2986056 RepID=A0A9E2BF98_PSYF1|nr:Thiol-disulfide oxidoreductase ResA [Candidatus Psychracetigena formicireducens]MBT9144533.1 Thiol-disulfide oxidoreductase ResA [Candidatus Psychracetigena formicireducens]